MNRLISVCWAALLAAIVLFLMLPDGRELFEKATRAHPYPMGALKIGLLGIMGELLGKRILRGEWQLRGIRLWQRALVWTVLGVAFAVVFPLFSFGVEGLIGAGLLPSGGAPLFPALAKSVFINLLFGFPMMVFHRFTDTLIERGSLFSRWPVVETFVAIDWGSMFRVVAFACLWFWVPAHTVTFLLPAEYRILCAAMLAIALGFIMGLANKRRAKEQVLARAA